MATAEELIKSAYELRRSGDRLGSECTYRDAADLAQAAGSSELRAHALRHVAELAAERGASELAITAADEALAIYQGDPDRRSLDLANAYRVRALAFESSGRAEEARENWRAAGNLYQEMGVSAGVAEAKARAEAN